MGKKFALIIIVLAALLLSACEQNIGTPVPTPKKGGKQAQASATVDSAMGELELFGTQTAEALAGTPSDGLPSFDEGTATVTPGGLEQPTLDPNFPTPTGDIQMLATVTPQVIAQPTVQIARPGTYVLQQGEFIFCLARRFNVDVNQTLALNGLVDSETIQPGLVVQIPASGNFAGERALRQHPATYTVRSGDSIYSIACQYGDVDPLNIAAVNGLAAPYTLTVGAQINIP